ncbi:hypothetical protein DL93DRAFT_1453505 [Clavulina sp. PMI_390]|nr:hypothetical protein DL93DRAFT_1453505 [Clavulina sp. PMI_390]
MVDRLQTLAGQLKLKHQDDELTYPAIRESLLELPGINPAYIYKPDIPLKVELGDVGYLRGSEFIRLGTIRDSIAAHHLTSMPEYTTASSDISSVELLDGQIRHEVESAHYVEIARWKRSEAISDSRVYWPAFAKKTTEILAEMDERNQPMAQVSRTDLILVTCVAEDYRLGIYRYHVDEAPTDPPPNLVFIEFTSPDDPRAVEWYPDGMTLPDSRVFTREEHLPQYISFFQMEDGD